MVLTQKMIWKPINRDLFLLLSNSINPLSRMLRDIVEQDQMQ